MNNDLTLNNKDLRSWMRVTFNKIRRVGEQILSNASYRKSDPSIIYKNWRNITSSLVSEKYFQQAGLENVWVKYPGKKDRQIIVIQCLQTVISKQIEGVVAEFGCYKGHTAIQIVQTMDRLKDKSKFYLFDSFQGVPESACPEDWYWRKGDLKAEYEQVKKRFAPFKNIEIAQGYFKETLPSYTNLKIKFAHVDADLYTSIKEVNEWLFSHVAKGGIIVYDDYGFETCPGAMKAVNEDFQAHPDFFTWYLPTGQFIALKY